jgi:2-polyprenyl-3-methyl-5-hydroxy-6-metoxy-1,4-benzoquinol methylase
MPSARDSRGRWLFDWRLLLGRRPAIRAPAAADAAEWDRQYAAGRWDYLEQLPELARHSVLAGYAAFLRPGGSILDVGCGRGVLCRRLSPTSFSRYLGVDLSRSAIEGMPAVDDARCTFLTADAEHYAPTERFDTIVFSEVLYYFRAPLVAVERYRQALRDDGIMLVSTWTASEIGLAILAQLRTRYPVLTETQVSQLSGEHSWIITGLAAGSQLAGLSSR